MKNKKLYFFYIILSFLIEERCYSSQTPAPKTPKIENIKTPDLLEVQNQNALESLETYIRIQAGRQEALARRAHEIMAEDANNNSVNSKNISQ